MKTKQARARGKTKKRQPMSSHTLWGVETKLPFHEREEMQIRQDKKRIVIKGETFEYTFSKNPGLLTGIRILGKSFSAAGFHYPDMFVNPDNDPRKNPYCARLDQRSTARLQMARRERAVVRASGTYVNRRGKAFPLRWEVIFEIYIDGVMWVHVTNRALRDCTFRFLVHNRGEFPLKQCRLFSHNDDVAFSQVTQNFKFSEIPGEPGVFLEGLAHPWVWFGNERTGFEVNTWDFSQQRYGRVEYGGQKVWGTDPMGDPAGMFRLEHDGKRVAFTNFLIRNVSMAVQKGWQVKAEYALGITPPRALDRSFALLKGYNKGPYTYAPRYRNLSDEELQAIADEQYNYGIGFVNWKTGEYRAHNQKEATHALGFLRERGVPVIPYMTFHDLNTTTDAYKKGGYRWAIDPVIDHGYYTHLMCPGAKGWRSHWKKQITRVWRDYNFGGFYFDFWYGRMVCESPEHGCQARFGRISTPGMRDMCAFAYNLIKRDNPQNILRLNVNLLVTTMICSMADFRLVGESKNIDTMSFDEIRGFYYSKRLGSHTEMISVRDSWDAEMRLGLALFLGTLPQTYRLQSLPREERDKIHGVWEIFRSFDVSKAEWHMALDGQGVMTADTRGVAVNVWARKGRLLVALVNTTTEIVETRINSVDYTQLGIPRQAGLQIADARESRILRETNVLQVEAMLAPWHSALYLLGKP